ncbi:MAG: carboxylating nicotinate-nucleotide diphosphorylase [Candidatus Auribacterota bacterium]|nr:carboxylating nicotinate-nucleotide diphosphorylase [Candidatus Auribacterota bacterium]
MPYIIDQQILSRIVQSALEEDIGSGDITTEISVHEQVVARGNIFARQKLVVAGMPVVREIFRQMQSQLDLTVFRDDGSCASPNDCIAFVEGNARSILTAERVALNFLQRLSGIATLTAQYVQAVEGTNAVILDTRKTTPGLRMLEKYAVKVGGGENHRFGLYDQFLFKDNHIAAGSGDFASYIETVIKNARMQRPGTFVEVEVDSLEQFQSVLHLNPDCILLDNFSTEDLRKAVALNESAVLLEASGGVSLDRVRSIACTGVDRISVGAITHSACAVDISMDLELCRAKN